MHILIGTDLTSSLLAGALSRVGSVLHLDSGLVYGSQHQIEDAQSLLEKKVVHYLNGHPTDTADMDLPQERRLSVERTPKLVLARGDMIELIIQSGASGYLDFRLLEGLYFYQDTLQKVPSSKEDIFAHQQLTLIEKRKLMKFLTSSLQQMPSGDNQIEEQQIDKDFEQHLEESGIKEKWRSVIKSALVLELNNKRLTLVEGMQRLKRHLSSVGRYGKSGLLSAMYGTSSELCQGFCRYCAVYGGTYMLDFPIESIDWSQKPYKVIGSDIKECDKLVVGSQFSHLLGLPIIRKSSIYRCIVITKQPIAEGHALIVEPSDDEDGLYCIQYTADECVCAQGYVLTLKASSKQRIEQFLEKMQVSGVCCFYEQPYRQYDTSSLPDDIVLLQDDDGDLLADGCVKEAKSVFERWYPSQPFYPPKEEQEEE
ncbi:GDP dissociation inhibitor-domain-containing protein [Gorgonomyces haynaldii]|nr:GDP dissociation inhibitor-domain-containing protein [Gorgonomyces haynaldii]